MLLCKVGIGYHKWLVRHCERSDLSAVAQRAKAGAIQPAVPMDCFVALLFAMTGESVGPIEPKAQIRRSGRAPPDIVLVVAVPVHLIGRHQFGARTHKPNSIGAGLAYVRDAPGSDQIPHRNETTRCAKRRHS